MLRSLLCVHQCCVGCNGGLGECCGIAGLRGFAGQYPREWEPAEAEAFISHLRCGARPVAVSTARGYETALRLSCEY
jgi:hypothetical protein